jgi:hypothetical protein
VRGLGEEDDKKTNPPQPDEEVKPGGTPGQEQDEWQPKQRQPAQDPAKYGDQLADMSEGARQRDADYGVKILSDADRENFRVASNEDGQLVWNATGELVDTPDHPAIYIMDKDGNIFLHPDPEFGEIHHSSLANGQPVAGAGEMQVIQGQPVEVNDKSGHYGGNLPDGAPGRVKNEMNSQGVDTAHTSTEEYQS